MSNEYHRRWFKQDQWYEGVSAHRYGRGTNECPYHPNSHKAASWHNGWQCAEVLSRPTVHPSQLVDLPNSI
jgi:ribosome modulation factor